jgi:hypothetical protein
MRPDIRLRTIDVSTDATILTYSDHGCDMCDYAES